MIKVVKPAKGVMCERVCCANCRWFYGPRPGYGEDESNYYRYRGGCGARSDGEDVSAGGYCGEYERL